MVYICKETFQRTPEAQVEHRFPKPTGIVPVPRGSRGPRSLYLRRYGDSFGFTLRHFIVYPPDGIAEQYDGRHAAVGALLAPMDTIFVKHVKERGPARQAGLQKGDRLVAVNGISVKDKPYSQVVQLIVNSPEYLHLLVVPKEDDVLQKFFSETAYNPVSNQPSYPEIPCDRQSAQQIISRRLANAPAEFQVDAISWRSLQQPYYQAETAALQRAPYDRGQRSADNLLYCEPRQRHHNQQEIYAEIHPHDIGQRNKCRAAPQVPLYKKMGRRASEGNVLSDRYESPDYCSLNADDSDDYNRMKAAYKSNYLPDTAEMAGLNYSNAAAGCRLSSEVGRRESTSSLSSSLADGSKDSFGSFDSNSTLTGHETDDSAIMNRFRKSVQQKEEFLRMPSNTVEQAMIRREFYGRPKKLEKQMWPPNDRESPTRASKPAHQNFARVKNDIDIERDLVGPNQNGHYQVQGGGAAFSVPQQRGATSPKERANGNLDRMYEGAIAPSGYDSMEAINGSVVGDAAYYDDRRVFSPPLQIVHKRAKDFESGRPLPEDDPVPGNRMNFSRSELARLSSKKLVPNVTERAHEYETRAVIEPRRDTSLTSTISSSNSVLKRIQRDSRSLDSSGSNESSVSVNEILLGDRGLSGNVTVSSGSKYLHCPLPADWQSGGRPTDASGNEATKMRARSNSAESWVAALGSDRNNRREGGEGGIKRISRQDAAAAVSDRNKAKEPENAMDVTSPATPAHHPPYADLPPLIPEPVEHLHVTPSVSISPVPTSINRAVRPCQLDLTGPVRPMRHLRPPSANIESPVRRSLSPNLEDKPVVVKRRPKNTNIVDDERAMRRESYLKATEGGRMHIDSDLSDGGDISPQALRSGSASSSSASLDREKASASPVPLDKDNYGIVREGTLHCKILEIDGKRAADRSWKQVFVVLKGPKLFVYKDRNHQKNITAYVDPPLFSGLGTGTVGEKFL
ncbi:hypothetical protein JTB14_024491 [Gonioctena quinquepunctata]|nr:hypothetical protein JTB14_024491 [Gonioctena quinquepunctata]